MAETPLKAEVDSELLGGGGACTRVPANGGRAGHIRDGRTAQANGMSRSSEKSESVGLKRMVSKGVQRGHG